jgi:hypothetical protein
MNFFDADKRIGCFEYYQLILKPILTYRDLRSGVLQVFRELGNIIVFIDQLESALVIF